MENIKTKKIKYLRESKFTEKRDPYKKYQKAKWKWSDIFDEIDILKENINKGFFKIISEKYGIKYKTLRNKYSDYKNNKLNNFDNENRGGSNKIFSELEEYEIFLFLKENFIDKNKPLCNEIIKLHAIEEHKKNYINDKFDASIGWCDLFKQKWNLNTVKCSISRKATTVYSEDELNNFLKKCMNACVKVRSNFFLT